MNIEDIDVFLPSSGAGRDTNDEKNKLRESVLEKILTNDAAIFCNDQQRGAAWSLVRNGWRNTLITLGGEHPSSVTKKGGRNHNYDFLVEYPTAPSRKIEFKFGCSSLSELPEFLNLGADKELHSENYARFFWSGDYLDRILALYEFDEPKPSLEVYEKEVKKNSSTLPFFVKLKQAEKDKPEHYKPKSKIVAESITAFLEHVKDSTNLTLLTQLFQQTQEDKVFILYNPLTKNFTVDSIHPAELTALSVKEIRKGNVLVIQSGKEGTTHEMLLRWKNHLGVLLPAWQISMKRQSS
jgi:hypothetical protein